MACMALETREGDQELIAKISAASEQDEDDDQARATAGYSGGGADAQMEKDMEYPTKRNTCGGVWMCMMHRDYTKWSYEHWRYPGLTRKTSEKAPLSPGSSSENDSWEPWNMFFFEV